MAISSVCLHVLVSVRKVHERDSGSGRSFRPTHSSNLSFLPPTTPTPTTKVRMTLRWIQISLSRLNVNLRPLVSAVCCVGPAATLTPCPSTRSDALTKRGQGSQEVSSIFIITCSPLVLFGLEYVSCAITHCLHYPVRCLASSIFSLICVVQLLVYVLITPSYSHFVSVYLIALLTADSPAVIVAPPESFATLVARILHFLARPMRFNILSSSSSHSSVIIASE